MSSRAITSVAKKSQVITLLICGIMLVGSSSGCRTPWLSASSDKSKFDSIVVSESNRPEARSRVRNAIPANQRMSMSAPTNGTKGRTSDSYDEDAEVAEDEEILAAMNDAPPQDRERLRLTYEALKNRRKAGPQDQDVGSQDAGPQDIEVESDSNDGNSFSFSDDESVASIDEAVQEVTIQPLQPLAASQKRTQPAAAKRNLSDQSTTRQADHAVATASANTATPPPITPPVGTPVHPVSTSTNPEESAVVSAAAVAVADAVNPAEPIPATEGESKTTDYRKLLHEAIAAAKAEQSDTSVTKSPEQKRNLEASLRMMSLLVGDLDAAEVPIEGLQLHEQEYFRNVFHAMYDALDPQGNPVLSRRCTLVMQSHRKALSHLAAVSNLEVQNVAFCTEVDSYGIISKFPQYHFRPDQELLLYCELDNFVAEPVKDGFQTQLQGSYEIVDSNGRRVADQLLPMDEHICRNQRRDYFIAYRMYMPQDIKPGRYQLKLTIEDMKGRKFGQSNVDFQVVN